MVNGQFKVFVEFKRSLLEKREIARPDGRSLYKYKLTADEFNQLEDKLKLWLGRIIGAYDLGDVIKLSGFPSLFVLYAAEWWRRRYDGSGFSWEPMLRDLQVSPDDWTAGERSRCIKHGLSEWGLQLEHSGGMRYLGSVAVQGGLPLRLLAESRGGVGKLLQRVLQLADGVQATDQHIAQWVESLRQLLPKSYRQEAIFTLLSTMISVVLCLKREAGLSSGDDAVSILDRKVPNWKEYFPLSMEDQHARALVEQLVRDASNVRVRKVKASLPVVRSLEQNSNGDWALISRIELPDTLDARSLATIFGMNLDDLPRVARMSVQACGNLRETTARRLAGHDTYRLEPKEWRFEGEAAQEEHLLKLSTADGFVWPTEAHHGGCLDAQQPWLFSVESNNHEMLREGSGSIAPVDALLTTPDGWRVQAHDGAEVLEQGYLHTPPRNLFLINGSIDLIDPSGQKFSVRTGQENVARTHFAWGGDRVWLDFIAPSRAYRGQLQLYRVDDEGSKVEVSGMPRCSVLGAPAACEKIGPVELQYSEADKSQIRTRMLLLPRDAKLEVIPINSSNGQLQFRNWGAQGACVCTTGIKQKKDLAQGCLTVTVSVANDMPAPEWLEIELTWPHTTSIARLRVPFPAQGVRGFDAKGKCQVP